MPYKKIALAAFVFLVFILGSWAVSSVDEELSSYSAQESENVPKYVDEGAAKTQKSETVIRAERSAAALSVPEFESTKARTQILDAMTSFDQLSQYPPTSQPIINSAHVNSFVNSTLPSSSLPFPIVGLETPIELSVQLGRYNYFFGDAVTAEIVAKDLPPGAALAATAVLLGGSGEELARLPLDVSQQSSSQRSLSVEFDTLNYDSSAWPVEMNLGAYVDVDGSSLFISAPFRINTPTGTVDSLGYSQVNGEYLDIPVTLDVLVPGYYFLSAVLYSAGAGGPLVYLETEGPVEQGVDSLVLHAHVQALKKGGDEGPYQLKEILLERWSDELIPLDLAGKVNPGVYELDGYRFDEFEDLPYIDPLKEERLRLMQGLGSL
mgnify:FL=1